MLPFSRWTTVAALFLVLAWIATPGCGGDDDSERDAPGVTFKKTEAKTLREEGTAANEAEAEARAAAAEHERKIKLAKKEFVQAFKRLSLAEDDFDRAEALAAVIKLGPDAAEFADRITPYLSAEDEELRSVALRAWASLKRLDGLQQIQQALHDDSDQVRATAARLWRLVKPQTVSPLLPLLADFSSDVQTEAMKSIAELSEDQDVIDEVAKRITDMDGGAAKIALEYLLAHKGSVRDLEAKLLALFDHQDPRVRVDAVRAVGKLGLKKYGVAEKLVFLLGDDPDDQVRLDAYKILKAWAGGDGPAYDPQAEGDALRAGAERWRTWLANNRTKLGS